MSDFHGKENANAAMKMLYWSAFKVGVVIVLCIAAFVSCSVWLFG